MRETRAAGRPREFDVDAALTTIMNVFWRNGFEATSLSDIVEATGLKKGSLYAAFGDKRAMYAQSLARYQALVEETVARLLAEARDPADRLRDFFDGPIAEAVAGDPNGCFLCKAATDQAPVDAEAAVLVRRGFERLGAALETLLALRDPAADPASRSASARLLLAAYLGLRAMASAGVARETLEAARDAALAHPDARPAL